MPKISIIIPVRDSTFLSKTVESVLIESEQHDVDIIVVNDGQNYKIDQMLSKYPVRVIGGDNGGPSSARNIGILSSDAEMLIFLDADCIVLPGWLSVHLGYT
ncbi:MAG: glycosyltransferase family 2 protein [Candidatus Anammoxibacter sp.]